MNVGKAIQSILNSAGIAVGAGLYKQATTANAVVYHIISNAPEPTKSAAASVNNYLVQIDIHGANHAGCAYNAGQVKSALDYYQGTAGGVVVDLIRLQNEHTDYVFENRTHRIIQEYSVRTIE